MRRRIAPGQRFAPRCRTHAGPCSAPFLRFLAGGSLALPAALLSITASSLPAQTLRARATPATAFIDVAVREESGVRTGQTVLVEDGVIRMIGPVATVGIAPGSLLVEGRGRTLMPGFVESRAPLPESSETLTPENLLLSLLAHGVTTVTAVRSEPQHDAFIRAVQQDTAVWPRLSAYSSGDPAPPASRGSILVGAPADLVLLEGGLVPDDPSGRSVAADDEDLTSAVAGVMVGGRFLGRVGLRRRIEARAQELVRDYYESIPEWSRQVRGPRESMRQCDGDQALQRCLGGDIECTLAYRCVDARVLERRAVLRERLAYLGDIAPSSDWIVGQQVNYALKDQEPEEARRISRECRASAWWCHALQGYTMHLARQGSGRAEFDAALATAPADQPAWAEPRVRPAGDRGLVCEWNDPRYLTRSSLRSDYLKREPCQNDDGFQDLFWWLADPLWSSPGNERWDEHVARNIEMRLHDELQRARGAGYHTSDMQENVMPAGWPTASRLLTVGSRAGRLVQQTQIYTTTGGYSFAPDVTRFRDPTHSPASVWKVASTDGWDQMRTRETWYDVSVQTAALRREGRVLALTAGRLGVLVPLGGVRATLAMGRPSDRTVEAHPARVDVTGVVRASAELEDAGWIASVEVIGPGWRARAREGITAPALVDGFGISTPILVDDRFENTDAALAAAMLPGNALAERSTIGLYFEVYGTRAEEQVQLALSAVPVAVERSLLGRLGEKLGLGGEDAPLRLTWTEAAELSGPGRAGRHLVVDSGTLRKGEYDLVLEVAREGGAASRSVKRIRIE